MDFYDNGETAMMMKYICLPSFLGILPYFMAMVSSQVSFLYWQLASLCVVDELQDGKGVVGRHILC